ncbi:nitrogen regulation protein NR(I) [Pseudomonadales bacterium]|jgi:two-component system nitrogen regulation response regulator GlnG|nr:nitrogen regulation protein NR(I) [bacterium]MDB4421056.1 nitrogen regulation protein NR(I) [Pseudomonadales bacterium]MDB4529096.1 nitrogen regulation protein NR(I) [Pseudomonadales bacterium]MDB4542116.1 nitrogen regulation protein NR(I) [Pseudomonadales bacterium]
MQQANHVWVVDDDKSIRWVLEKALTRSGIEVDVFTNGEALLEQLESNIPDVVISDIRMPGINGLDMLEKILVKHPKLPVIITTAHSDLDNAVSSYQNGAFEYLPKPFDIDEVVAMTRRALAVAEENLIGYDGSNDKVTTEMIGRAPAMQEVFRAIGRLSHSNINVLINGESGTGKELVAKALHKHSPRREQAFIALNMAAIPKDLVESELFGHEKGAFTGAAQQRIGRFEQANHGTLFLDEIGDMPADIQTRLLRVLADGEFYRVGGHTPVKVDVRIIAATHQNLEELVGQKLFRDDLFHRLNVIRMKLPKLCDRSEDIPQLAAHFLQDCSKELNVETKILSVPVIEHFYKLPWPGNVRQLENVCRWLTVMAVGTEIQLADLPDNLLDSSLPNDDVSPASSWHEQLSRWATHELQNGEQRILDAAVPIFEKSMIEVALQKTNGRKRDASLLLGWGRNTLTRKMKELGMKED